ncbi:MAG: nitroreductase [Clostridia bacterium]|nr:nitroreductase [Clostridia bacterium]
MNEVLRNIRERRSVRKFKSEMPDKKLLAEIAEAGVYAASGMGRQATKTIVVTDPATRETFVGANREIGGWDKGFDPFYNAPAILVVLFDKSCRTGIYDGSLVMGNMMLAAHALGLGSIWIHRAKEEFETNDFKKWLADLGITGEWEGVGHLAVGYADCPLPAAAERKPDRIVWVE